jgi:hypothetical protein
MTPDDTGRHRDSAVQQTKPDWVYIGSLVVIAVCLLGMACIFWTHYRLVR